MSEDELSTLRTEAEAAGVKVDRRWGADRLRAEIAAAHGMTVADVRVLLDEPATGDESQGADPKAVVEQQPDSEAAQAEQAVDEPAEVPAVHRAGGHIDRGDGYGWVIEQDEE